MQYPRLLWADLSISHNMSWQHFAALLPVLWMLHSFCQLLCDVPQTLRGGGWYDNPLKARHSTQSHLVSGLWTIIGLCISYYEKKLLPTTLRLRRQLGNPFCFCYSPSLRPSQGWALMFVLLSLIVSPFPKDHIVRIVWYIDFSNWSCLLTKIYSSLPVFPTHESFFSALNNYQ